ncbi:MAG: hypothetical protein OEW12_03735 [Deltaproteobacteria bacterium]|nr:hypothetical protein [Deltaproteobacteria bacterium]
MKPIRGQGKVWPEERALREGRLLVGRGLWPGRGIRAGLFFWGGMVLLAWGAPVWAAPPQEMGPGQPQKPGSDPDLAFVEQLYQTGDDFRAETEILRLLHTRPPNPLREKLELTRAKLYYRQGRYPRAAILLVSLLDRPPNRSLSDRGGGDGVESDARRLLGFTLVRQGRMDEARQTLYFQPVDSRYPLPAWGDVTLEPPWPDPSTARAWSIWLPGSGFFYLDQPAKGAAAVGLNLGFIGGAAITWQQGNTGAALVFLLLEWALYTGGRDAARDEALLLKEQAAFQRRTQWLERAGEPALLKMGFSTPF